MAFDTYGFYLPDDLDNQEISANPDNFFVSFIFESDNLSNIDVSLFLSDQNANPTVTMRPYFNAANNTFNIPINPVFSGNSFDPFFYIKYLIGGIQGNADVILTVQIVDQSDQRTWKLVPNSQNSPAGNPVSWTAAPGALSNPVYVLVNAN